MEFVLEKQLQGLFQTSRFRQVDDFSGNLLEVVDGFKTVVGGIQVFEVNHTQCLIGVTILAKRVAGIAFLVQNIQTGLECHVRGQIDNFWTGLHDLSYQPLAQFHGIEHNIPFQHSAPMLAMRVGNEHSQFLFRVHEVVFGNRFDPHPSQHFIGGFVQCPNEGVRGFTEPPKRLGNPKRGG